MAPALTFLNKDPEKSQISSWPPSGEPLEKDFDHVLLLASQICDVSIAAITQVSNGHTFFKAIHGWDCQEIGWAREKDESTNEAILLISDALTDKHFSCHPLVKGEPNIRFYAEIPLITETGILLGHLCVMDKKPGSLTDLQVSTLRTLAKSILCFLSLKSQLQEFKKNDDLAVRNEELMETIFHDAIDGVIVSDENGIILKWNPKAEEMFGWRAIEVIGKPFYNTVIPGRHQAAFHALLIKYQKDNDEQMPGNIAGKTAGNIAGNAVEIHGRRKDHTEFNIELSISPATIRQGRFFIFFVSDITDRKLTAEKLDKQKVFYENILNKLPTDVAVFNAEHRYLFVNPAAISKEEYREFIIGKDDYEYVKYRNREIAVADVRRARFLEVKNSGKEVRWEDSLPDPDGNIITHLRRMYPVYDDNGDLTLVIGFGIDITDRKLMEEKQTAYVKQVSVQNTQLIDFCSIVSHNLRAPLVNISMLVDFIESSEDPDEQKLLISKLRPVIDNLHNTFNELVESIQIRRNLEIKSEDVSLNDCIKRTVDGLQTEISKLDASLEVDFNEGSVIRYPPQYLNSIIHNLVSNSLKYHHPGRKPVIVMKTRKVDDSVILSVSDNGLGIDLVKHKENFFKIGKVFHRHPNAKGFGLFMTKTQVEAMGGKIWVESVPGNGTVFYIEFTNQKRKAS